MLETQTNALPRGYRIDEYEVLRVLGAGGFGITYLAFDHHLDGPVAIKEYFPANFATRSAGRRVTASSNSRRDVFAWGLERFIAEARAIHRFRHPNVVQVHRYLEAHGTAYIVMEYIEGESLAATLRARTRLLTSEWRRWLDPLLNGLAHVHSHGYLHRDIKPTNIIIRTADGEPVLIDFGTAREAARNRTHTQVLTPGYAPIEQHGSEMVQGPPTDIYALAAVSYRALTGQVPRSAPDRVLHGRHQPLAVHITGPDRAWLTAIDQGLELRPEDRPQTVEAWRRALHEAADTPVANPDSPVSGSTSTQLQATPKGSERKFGPISLATGGLAALALIAGALWLWQSTPADWASFESPDRIRAADASAEPAVVGFGEGDGAEPGLPATMARDVAGAGMNQATRGDTPTESLETRDGLGAPVLRETNARRTNDRSTARSPVGPESSACTSAFTTDVYDYDPDAAYAFGLRIQAAVRARDLTAFFSLVDGELLRGPRRRFAVGRAFGEVFPDSWRTEILDSEVPRHPVGWRGFMLANGALWYQECRDDVFSIHRVNDWVPEEFPPVPTGWRVGDDLLSPECFVTKLTSGENYRAFRNEFSTPDDLFSHPGRYFGDPIHPFESVDGYSLWRRTSDCIAAPGSIRTENSTIVHEQDDSRTDGGFVPAIEYTILAEVPEAHCRELAPNLPGTCLESYLVLVADYSSRGGSMTSVLCCQPNIYGLFMMGDGERIIFPLRNFRSENLARNALDSEGVR